MAGGLVQASLKSPGFMGLNTEQQAASTQERFASQLDNAVFDESGKVVCRKGFDKLADSGPDSVSQVFAWRQDEDTTRLMAVGDASGTATLYEMTTTSTEFDTFSTVGTFASENVKLINCNGELVILENGQAPKYWTGTGSLGTITNTGSTSVPTGGVGMTAFGRLFISSQDGTTLFASEIQPTPSSGIDVDNWFIDLTGSTGTGAKGDGWAIGNDFITACSGVRDMIVIFGSDSIVTFTGINGTVVMVDSITGVGCINQHTVANTGDDILFLSNDGVRSLWRTMHSDTVGLADVSAFIRTDLIGKITASDAKACYSEIDGFYLLSDGASAFAFDIRFDIPGGAKRVSEWTLAPTGMAYCPCANRLFLSSGDAVGEYAGYDDDGSSYKLTLKSQWLDLGMPRLKIVKKVAAIIFKGDGYTPKVYLAFDYDETAEESLFGEALPLISQSEWNSVDSGEWGLAEWSGEIDQVNQRYVQGSGSGLFVRYGLEFTVDTYEVGIHEIRLLAKMGKLAHV